MCKFPREFQHFWEVKFPFLHMSIWDRKRLLNLMIFRTKNHKIPTSAKVVSSLSFFRCFGGYFGTFGHMSIWDRKRLLKCNLFGTTWALRNAQTVVFLVKNRWKTTVFYTTFGLGATLSVLVQKTIDFSNLFLSQINMCKNGNFTSQKCANSLGNFNISGRWNFHFCTCRFETGKDCWIWWFFGPKVIKLDHVEK